jgi:hypothetical protein
VAKKTKQPSEKQELVVIPLQDLLDLVFWARRYCDKRSTYGPIVFNEIYSRLMKSDLSFREKDTLDITLMDNGAYWPYAQDAMYDPISEKFNAIPSSDLLDQEPLEGSKKLVAAELDL